MKWPMVKLGDVVTLINGRAYKKHEMLREGKYPLMRVGNFFSNRDWYYSDLELPEKQYCDNGDLIYAWSASFGPQIWQGGKVIYHYHIWKLMVDESLADKKYLFYALKRDVDFIKAEQGSGSTMVHVTKTAMENRAIPLPPLEEQKRIAAILDKADGIRRKRQQAIKLADEFLRSVFLDMFGDPVTNPKGWDIRPLEDCLEFLTSGSRGWAQYYSDQGSKFIRIQNVSKNRLLLEDMAYVNAPDGAESTRTRVQIGDVLLSITADLGRSAVVNDEIAGGHINQHLALLRVNQSKINSRFLSAYLSSDGGVKQFQMKNKSAVKAGLNFNDIRTLMIPIPPLNIQKKYENIYDHISIMNEHCLSSSNEIKNQIAVLSQKAFSGGL